MHPANDGDFMSMVEKRAEDSREAAKMKDDVIHEMDMLKGEKEKRSKRRHKHYLM